jgi:hypothetical protein
VTYGYPGSLSAELWSRLRSGQRPALRVLEGLAPHGLRRVKDITPAKRQAAGYGFPRGWPVVSIYALEAPALRNGAGSGTRGAGGRRPAVRAGRSGPAGAGSGLPGATRR